MNTLQQAIDDLKNGGDLSLEEAQGVALSLLNSPQPTPLVVEFLDLLRTKGETTDEILGFIYAMRQHMKKMKFRQKNLIDICGTGGSLPNRFNVSTCVALILGKLGYPIAKHGNRGSKRANGSFDFLDALNIPYELSESEHQARLDKHGVTFLFARYHHPAVRYVAEARQQLAGRSIFNLIGPFCNPASPSNQIIGTPNHQLANRLIDVAKQLNYHTFAVISSDIGLDECSTVGQSAVQILRNNDYSSILIKPTDCYINHELSDISVSDQALAIDNAKLFKQIINDKSFNHPIMELILLNCSVIKHVIDTKKPISEIYNDLKTQVSDIQPFSI